MRLVLVVTRVSGAVLMLCLLVITILEVTLAYPPAFIAFGIAFVFCCVATVELFSVYLFPHLLSFVPVNKVIAGIFNISPLSAWKRKPVSQLTGAMLFGIGAVLALTKALGYW